MYFTYVNLTIVKIILQQKIEQIFEFLLTNICSDDNIKIQKNEQMFLIELYIHWRNIL